MPFAYDHLFLFYFISFRFIFIFYMPFLLIPSSLHHIRDRDLGEQAFPDIPSIQDPLLLLVLRITNSLHPANRFELHQSYYQL
jgi:hypothetical protein